MERETQNHNLSVTFERVARTYAGKIALRIPVVSWRGKVTSYKEYTFGDLCAVIDRYASGFSSYGLKPNMKAVLFVRPGSELVAIVFALLKIGVVPVLIDGGIGRRKVIDCIRQARPDIFIGVPEAWILKYLYTREFESVRFSFILSKYLPFFDTVSFQSLNERGEDLTAHTHRRAKDDLIFLLFTSGSTGPPKGVIYTPSILEGQLATLRDTFYLTSDDVDMPVIPALVIGTLCLGMTVVVPPLNPIAPMSVNPKTIAHVVNECGVTFSFGSPAIWGKIALYCMKQGIRFPKLKRLVVAGAPTNTRMLRIFRELVPNGRVCTPLGATECTPITYIDSEEIDHDIVNRQESGGGFCVGRPTRHHTIKIIPVLEDDIPTIAETTFLNAGGIGEVIVKGPVVTHAYYEDSAATKKAKIYESTGEVWHRTGDVGYVDDRGRLWFCGRKAHICTYAESRYYSVQVEHCFASLPGINRVALVNVSEQEERVLALCIETAHRYPSKNSKALIAKDVGYTALRHRLPLKLIFFYPKPFPVDRRHHAKIERHLIAEWAQRALGSRRYKHSVYAGPWQWLAPPTNRVIP